MCGQHLVQDKCKSRLYPTKTVTYMIREYILSPLSKSGTHPKIVAQLPVKNSPVTNINLAPMEFSYIRKRKK